MKLKRTNTYHHYYPFGMLMPRRTWDAESSYRFGFQGQERDDEMKGAGNQIHYEFREYDTRICKMISIDPMQKEYPWQSSYAYFSNSPVWKIDYLGGGDDKKVASNPNNSETIHEERVALNKPQASTVTINYTRNTETANSTTGTFSVDNGKVDGYILEPAKGNDTETYTAGSDKRIADGTYYVKPYSSAKYPDNYVLLNVPGRSSILIHKGNTPDNTEGCLMPGGTQSTDFVGSSGPKYNQLNSYIKQVQANDKAYENRGETKIVIKVTTSSELKAKAFKQQKYEEYLYQLIGIY